MTEIIISIILAIMAFYLLGFLAVMFILGGPILRKQHKETIYKLLNDRDLIKSVHSSFVLLSKPFSGGYLSDIGSILPRPSFLQCYYYSDNKNNIKYFIGFWNFSLVKDIKFALDFSREYNNISEDERTEMFNRYLKEINTNENQNS